MTIANDLLAATYAEANDVPNTGWHFYRNYYEEGTGTVGPKNDKLERQVPRRIPGPDNGFANAVFQVKTTYPGLLIGTGYLHERKNEDDAIKIGFYFDHATGMPVLPGSSVKGALRGAFPQFSDDEASIDFDEDKLADQNPEKLAEKKEALLLKKERALFVHCLLFLIEGERPALSLEELQAIHAFEQETFKSQMDWRQGKDNGDNYRSIYHRDIFFDAVPVAILNANNGNKRQLFGMDYITPHKHKSRPELDPFTDPTPLKFLKVMPEVVYEFRFRLQPSQVWQGEQAVDHAKKEAFFQNLILFLGVGAKTNVGYGHFSDDLTVKEKPGSTRNTIPIKSTDTGGKKPPPMPIALPKSEIPSGLEGLLKNGKEFEGSIIGIEGDSIVISFKVGTATCKIQKKATAIFKGKEKLTDATSLGLADAVTVRIQRDYKEGSGEGLITKATLRD